MLFNFRGVILTKLYIFAKNYLDYQKYRPYQMNVACI